MVKVFNIKKGLFYGILHLPQFATSLQLSAKREIEKKGCAYLLQQLLHKNVEILYTESGKPYLPHSSIHLSISHSHDKLAIIINEHEKTGIDIELIRDKVKTIKSKFLSADELADAGEDTEKVLIYWAAKETLYKIQGSNQVEFIKHLFVNPFTKHNLGTLIGKINLLGVIEEYEVSYQIMEQYVLVYALKKI